MRCNRFPHFLCGILLSVFISIVDNHLIQHDLFYPVIRDRRCGYSTKPNSPPYNEMRSFKILDLMAFNHLQISSRSPVYIINLNFFQTRIAGPSDLIQYISWEHNRSHFMILTRYSMFRDPFLLLVDRSGEEMTL